MIINKITEMTNNSTFVPVSMPLTQTKTYLFSALFVIGNIALPQICHLFGAAGTVFLPIYFFTLIAGYKFGWRVGLMTALLSPAINSLAFGMPTAAVLPIIMIKSSLLAVAAATVAHQTKQVTLLTLLAVIAAYQIVGGAAQWAITGSFEAVVSDIQAGVPGMLIQLFVGYAALRWLARR